MAPILSRILGPALSTRSDTFLLDESVSDAMIYIQIASTSHCLASGCLDTCAQINGWANHVLSSDLSIDGGFRELPIGFCEGSGFQF